MNKTMIELCCAALLLALLPMACSDGGGDWYGDNRRADRYDRDGGEFAFGLPTGGASSGSNSNSPSIQNLDLIATRMLQARGSQLSGNIVANAANAQGIAAIRWMGNQSVISVNPAVLQRWTTNTWAFIIGHELSHALLRHQGGSNPQDEQAADRLGAELARSVGYSLTDYIRHICSQSNSCDPGHGCWHHRMQLLEQHFNVQACSMSSPGPHRPRSEHRPPPGPAPGGNGGCVSRGAPCNHGNRCRISAPFPIVQPCRHPPVRTRWGIQPMHPRGDIVGYQMRTVPAPFCVR